MSYRDPRGTRAERVRILRRQVAALRATHARLRDERRAVAQTWASVAGRLQPRVGRWRLVAVAAGVAAALGFAALKLDDAYAATRVSLESPARWHVQKAQAVTFSRPWCCTKEPRDVDGPRPVHASPRPLYSPGPPW